MQEIWQLIKSIDAIERLSELFLGSFSLLGTYVQENYLYIIHVCILCLLPTHQQLW